MPRRRRRQPAPPPDPTPIEPGDLPLIKVVGVSGSGKSTLVRGLRRAGYHARPVSQEHSNIPDLWRQFDPPALLIYLNASPVAQRARRPDVTWMAAARRDEAQRLAHAWEHADLRIDTSNLTPDDVLDLALTYLRRRGIRHAAGPLTDIPPTGTAARPPA